MRVTAKVDYAVRAMCELAARGAQDAPVKGEVIAGAQSIPQSFLENIMADLKRAGLVRTQRGQEGGYRLARPADAISIADVIRAVEGPLANVRGVVPEHVEYVGSARPLQAVWLALRAHLRAVLEEVTVGDVAADRLPAFVADLLADPDAHRAR